MVRPANVWEISLDGFVADLPGSILGKHLRDPLADRYEILSVLQPACSMVCLPLIGRGRNSNPNRAVTYSLIREIN